MLLLYYIVSCNECLWFRQPRRRWRPPQVKIIKPKNGEIISGIVTVRVSAQDDTGVITLVEFYLDNKLTLSRFTPPYLWNFNSTKVQNGIHEIQVIAYDPAGQFSSDSITVFVTNAQAEKETPKEITKIVKIDIKPKSYPNTINIDSEGVLPVAVFSTSISDGDSQDFDVSQIIPESVVFGPAQTHALDWSFEDVDNDEDFDIVFFFRTKETGLTENDKEAILSGLTLDDLDFFGKDEVIVIKKKKEKDKDKNQNMSNFFVLKGL